MGQGLDECPPAFIIIIFGGGAPIGGPRQRPDLSGFPAQESGTDAHRKRLGDLGLHPLRRHRRTVRGSLADRFGARLVSFYSMILAGPTLILALSMTGWPSYLLLAVGGTFLNIGVPVNVVMAQRLVPGGASTVAALMMGFAWGAGAMLAPVTGVLSQQIGFGQALSLVSGLTLIAAALLWRFPRDGREMQPVPA
ncbi:MAG: MFS transporter [Acidobacteriota bacterium]|nr:MAG: MFS transporter [Acidobacteriota bacterium]